MAGSQGRPRKATFTERRERRAAVDDPDEVLAFATRYLESRPRSVAEVRRRLEIAGFRPAMVEASVARLTDLRFLDDEAFARAWVESRDRAHPRGEQALRRELAHKGVDRTLVDAILAERRSGAGEPDADVAAAERLLERNARALARVDDPRLRRQRAYALLARHGFDPSVASDAARRLVSEDAGD